jgi:hypothetical protein
MLASPVLALPCTPAVLNVARPPMRPRILTPAHAHTTATGALPLALQTFCNTRYACAAAAAAAAAHRCCTTASAAAASAAAPSAAPSSAAAGIEPGGAAASAPATLRSASAAQSERHATVTMDTRDAPWTLSL